MPFDVQSVQLIVQIRNLQNRKKIDKSTAQPLKANTFEIENLRFNSVKVIHSFTTANLNDSALLLTH